MTILEFLLFAALKNLKDKHFVDIEGFELTGRHITMHLHKGA